MTTKYKEKNSIDVLFEWQNLEMEVRFWLIARTQRTLDSLKDGERERGKPGMSNMQT